MDTYVAEVASQCGEDRNTSISLDFTFLVYMYLISRLLIFTQIARVYVAEVDHQLPIIEQYYHYKIEAKVHDFLAALSISLL